jgi:non-haem Fe2+, alpha-ketoglutarate-dependent halogenase
MSRRLSDKQIRAYERDGFVFPISVLSGAEAKGYRNACDALEADLGGKPRTIDVRQMHLHFAWAFSLATQAAILDPVEQVLGPDILIWATELFTKHPQDSIVSVSWHRDEPYLGLIGGASTTAWVALSDSTMANGCMCVWPRSAEEVVAAKEGGVDSKPEAPLPGSESRIVAVILKAGEMSLHAADVLHGSGPSQSMEKRVGFVIRYITPKARPVHGKPPVILARGVDRYHHFACAEPPIGADTGPNLAAMRGSAVRHLDVVLGNLKRADRERKTTR